jgi:hypothetical protein
MFEGEHKYHLHPQGMATTMSGLSSCGRDIERLKSSYGRWLPLGVRSVRSACGVAVLLEEIDEDDEIVWLSEVKVEGSDERFHDVLKGQLCVWMYRIERMMMMNKMGLGGGDSG